MTDFKPSYESNNIKILEWPQPICEIYDKKLNVWLQIKTPEDAKAVIESLWKFLNVIPVEFGGTKTAQAYTGTGSDYLDCVLGVGGFEQYGAIKGVKGLADE